VGQALQGHPRTLSTFGTFADVIDCGANMSAQTKDEWTALHLALKNGHVDLGQMLIDCSADVSAQDVDG
jgi:ankyrin repeat protein